MDTQLASLKRSFLYRLIVMGIVLCIVTPTIGEGSNSVVAKGNALYLKARFDSAISYFTRAISQSLARPVQAQLYDGRGLSYEATCHYDLALADFDAAVRLDPSSALAHMDRGNLHVLLGEYDKGITDYTAAIERDPNCRMAFHKRENAAALRAAYNGAVSLPFIECQQLPSWALGWFYEEQGNHDEAIRAYTKCVKARPQSVGALYSRAMAYSEKGAYASAISDLNRAIALNPQFSLCYVSRSQANYQMRSIEQAIADLALGLKLNSSNYLACLARGRILAQSGRTAEAINDFTTATSVNPFAASALFERGACYLKAGDLQKALKDINRADTLDPFLPDPQNLRQAARKQSSEGALAKYKAGTDLLNAGRLGAAVEALEAAIALDPELIAAYGSRANAYTLMGNLASAIDTYDTLVRIQSTNVIWRFLRAQCAMQSEHYDMALHDFSACRDLGMAIEESLIGMIAELAECSRRQTLQQPSDYHKKGTILFKLNDYKRAIANYLIAARLNPDDDSVFGDMGYAYYSIGDFTNAALSYGTAIELNGRNEEHYANRGNVRMERGELKAAIDDFNRAIAINSNNPLVYFNRGIAYLRSRLFDQAIQDFTRVIQTNSSFVPALLNRANAYYDTGKYALAVTDCDTILNRMPNNPEALICRGYALIRMNKFREARVAMKACQAQGIEMDADFLRAIRNAKGQCRGIALFDGLPKANASVFLNLVVSNGIRAEMVPETTNNSRLPGESDTRNRIMSPVCPIIDATTDSTGAWFVPAVDPGTYIVTGFRPNENEWIAYPPADAKDICVGTVTDFGKESFTVNNARQSPIAKEAEPAGIMPNGEQAQVFQRLGWKQIDEADFTFCTREAWEYSKDKDPKALFLLFLIPQAQAPVFRPNINCMVGKLSAKYREPDDFQDEALRQLRGLSFWRQSIGIWRTTNSPVKFTAIISLGETDCRTLKFFSSWTIQNGKIYCFTFTMLETEFDKYFEDVTTFIKSIRFKR